MKNKHLIMNKILFVTNIPTPYRSVFFEKISEYSELTVIYESTNIKGLIFNQINSKSSYDIKFLNNYRIKFISPFLTLTKIIALNNYDIIFLTNFANLTQIYGYFLSIILKKKYAIEIDGAIKKKKEVFIKKIIKKLFFKNAIQIFSPSISSDEYLFDYGVKKSNITRYKFTSLELSDIAKLRSNKKTKTSNIKILFVSRIIKEKGIEILIEAFNDYCLEINSVKSELILIGYSPDEKYLNYIQRKMNSSTSYKGFLNREDLIRFYDSSDIFVFPSHGDIWGLVLNEAMARGLPVICSDKVNSASELIEDGVNGFIYNSHNKFELLNLIRFLILNESLRSEMSNNNIIKSREYTIEKMVLTHIDFLSKLNAKQE